MSYHSQAEVIETVARKSTRSAAVVHRKMKRGLDSLATIAATAPFVGLFGTVIGIFSCFGGGSGERWTVFAAVTGGISEALKLTALGLVVAIVASWFYSYLTAELETFDIEMRNASLDLVNRLALYRPQR